MKRQIRIRQDRAATGSAVVAERAFRIREKPRTPTHHEHSQTRTDHAAVLPAERFIGSVRREALDYYLLISETQIVNILQEYIEYYSKHPHQGIDQKVPMGYKPQLHGKVLKFPILGGLCNHYTRLAA